MAQILTVGRIGSGWGFRDVTGAEYAHSEDIVFVVEAAERMGRRLGGRVSLTPEAEKHYKLAKATQAAQADMQRPPQFGFRGLAWRLARWRKR